MTTTQGKPEFRTEFVTVAQMIPDVPGRDGPQKEIHLDVSFSQFPIKFWIPQDAPPYPKRGDQCWVTLNRGTLREGRDPSAEYNYRWYINKWDVEQPEGVEAPYTGELETTYKNNDVFNEGKAGSNEIPLWTKSLEHRIAWAQAVNLTKAYFNQHPLTDKEGTLLPTDDPLCQSEESYMSHLTYATICNGPDLDRWMPFIVDEPEEPATEPATESEGDGFPGGLG